MKPVLSSSWIPKFQYLNLHNRNGNVVSQIFFSHNTKFRLLVHTVILILTETKPLIRRVFPLPFVTTHSIKSKMIDVAEVFLYPERGI